MLVPGKAARPELSLAALSQKPKKIVTRTSRSNHYFVKANGIKTFAIKQGS
jgi:hypothetical protein